MPATIISPGLRQIEARHTQRARTDPQLAERIAAIRGGDETVLADLIRRLQTGDEDAGLDAVYALTARLIPLVRCTVRRHAERADALDDHLTIAYLVLTTIDADLGQLTNRILSRTWRRYARPLEAARRRPDQPGAFDPGHDDRSWGGGLGRGMPGDPTGDDVIHRLELHSTVAVAHELIRTGALDRDVWDAIVDIRINGGTSRAQLGTRSASGLRSAMARATVRIRESSAFDEAA